MKSDPFDSDLFYCPICGHKEKTSFGDCRIPHCKVCGENPEYFQKVLKENELLKKELMELKRAVSPPKVTIFVGTETHKANLSFPEYKRMPNDCARLVYETVVRFLLLLKQDMVINTCSSIPVNLVGEMINSESIKSCQAEVFYDGNCYHYDEKGVLVGWVYGVFDYDGLEQIKAEK